MLDEFDNENDNMSSNGDYLFDEQPGIDWRYFIDHVSQ